MKTLILYNCFTSSGHDTYHVNKPMSALVSYCTSRDGGKRIMDENIKIEQSNALLTLKSRKMGCQLHFYYKEV